MENTFFDLDTMTPKNGQIIEKCIVLDTIRALAIIDRHMYLVTATAGTNTYYYCGKMHRIYDSGLYHGHYIVKFQNNTKTWYCPFLQSIGYQSRHKSLDDIITIIDTLVPKALLKDD